MSRASDLLRKANTQLRGERVPLKTKEEDELSNYLTSLAQKTGSNAKSVSFEDYGEHISISSDSNLQKTPRREKPTPGGAASRFLKKKEPVEVSPYDQKPVYQQTAANKFVKKDALREKRPSVQTASALDKVKALSNKITERGAVINKRGSHFEADTDESVSLGAYMRHGSPDLVKSASEKTRGRDASRFLKKTKAEKPLEETEKIIASKIDAQRPSTPQRGQRRPLTEKEAPKPATVSGVPEYANKGQVKYVSSMQLTSEEESMADFIHRLSSADEAKKRIKENEKTRSRDIPSPDLSFKRTPSPPSRTPKRTPSPIYGHGRKFSRSPSQDSDNVDSIRSEVADTPETESSGNIFHSMNIMDLDSLEPVQLAPEPSEKKKKQDKKKKTESKSTKHQSKKSSSSVFKASKDNDQTKSKRKSDKKKTPQKSDSFFTSFGLHSVDELLGLSASKEESVGSETSEIATERSELFSTRHRNDSVSSIVTDIGQSQAYSESFDTESITEQIGQDSVQGQKQVRWSESEVKTEYSDESTQAEYDDDFESDSRVKSYTHSGSYSRSERSETDSYSSDADSYTYSAEKPYRRSSLTREKNLKSTEVQTEAPGLNYRWNLMSGGLAISGPGYGLDFVDPTPIASHVVSADALEAMTSYSPCMLALHDLMKQQLALTQSFLETQRRMYEASVASLENNFKYTTLQDTKEYIKKHRKPRLTFKQALKQVSKEMAR